MPDLVTTGPEWADAFRTEARRIRDAIGDEQAEIEHIGSTAVPGLIAKPVLDLAIRVGSEVCPDELTGLLSGVGYERNAHGPITHAVFIRSDAGRRTHILHAFADDAWDECPQRLVRDRLLRSADARRRYSALKTDLRARGIEGRAYTAAKSELIQELLDDECRARGIPLRTAWDK